MILLVPIEELPDRPSELIRRGLMDISECSRDFRYQVDIFAEENNIDFWDSVWHRLNRSKKACLVCMAGAVMAKSLYVEWGRNYTPDDFEPDTRKKLMALEALRQGEINVALTQILELPNNPLEVERKIVPYAQSRKLFCRQMTILADDLEAHGL